MGFSLLLLIDRALGSRGNGNLANRRNVVDSGYAVEVIEFLCPLMQPSKDAPRLDSSAGRSSPFSQ
jgi:hypothetical protein